MNRAEAQALRTLRWRFVHRRKRSPFFSYCFFAGCAQLVHRDGLDHRLWHMGVFEDRVAVDWERWSALEQKIIEQMDREPEWFLHTMRRCFREHRAAGARWKKLSAQDWQSVSSRELARSLEGFVEDLLSFDGYVTWPPIMEAELERRLRAGLDQSLGVDADAAFAVASNPVSGGSVLREKEALLKLALRPAKELDRALAAHARTFGWMKNVGFFGELYDAAHYREQVELARKQNPRKQLAQLEAQEKERARAFKKLLEQLRGRRDLQLWVKTANAAVAFRSYRTEIFYESYRFVRPLLRACAERLELSELELLHLFPDELLPALRGKANADRALIRERQDAYVYVTRPRLAYLTCAGAEARRLADAVLPENEGGRIEEIRGQPAFAGRVRGRAVLVASLADLKKVKRGDVLVTHATNIDYIPALRRAAAIVTEEGGILCHAAVVSREMRIPAVVGTGNATSVFQDGDRLDVDAKGGWVRRV